jgi:hypothetical protein
MKFELGHFGGLEFAIQILAAPFGDSYAPGKVRK